MIQHNEKQGTQEWLDLRENYKTASEASAMMGASPFKTRTELLDSKKGCAEKEVDAATQRRFDNGHIVEDLARSILEDEIGESLFAVTLSSGSLLASLDGKTMFGEIIFEHKAWNQETARIMTETGDCIPYHYWQLEQQLLVSEDTEKAIFILSDGTKENRIVFEYFSKPERRKALLAGWAQFDLDLKNHVVEVIKEAPEANPVMDLPAVSFKLDGLALNSNLDVYKDAAQTLLELSKKPLEDDQDFSNCEALNKKFEIAEKKIKEIQANVLGEVSDIDEFTKELGHIGELFRQARLNGQKQVKSRKNEIRQEIINEGKESFNNHIGGLNETFSDNRFVLMPTIASDFSGQMKNKRTIASLRDAAKSHLAHLKIQADEIAELIHANLKQVPKESMFLFNDIQHIITKDHSDFVNLVKLRIGDHNEALAKKEEEDAAAERFAASIKPAPMTGTPARPCENIGEGDDDEIIYNDITHLAAEGKSIQERGDIDAKALDILENQIIDILDNLPICKTSKGDLIVSKIRALLVQAVNVD